MNTVEQLGDIVFPTKKAILFMGHFDMKEPIWLPRSQIEYTDLGEEHRVEIAGWLAKKNGIEEIT